MSIKSAQSGRIAHSVFFRSSNRAATLRCFHKKFTKFTKFTHFRVRVCIFFDETIKKCKFVLFFLFGGVSA